MADFSRKHLNPNQKRIVNQLFKNAWKVKTIASYIDCDERHIYDYLRQKHKESYPHLLKQNRLARMAGGSPEVINYKITNES